MHARSALRLLTVLSLVLGLSACAPAAPSTTMMPAGVHAAPRPSAYVSPAESTQSRLPQPAQVVAQKTIKVGLLLPLTGRNAELGRAMQDAATIALFDRYAHLSTAMGAIRVELVPKDTGDTPEQAASAMRSALAEGAVFIIGPIFSDATQAAAPLALEKGVSVLSLSNNADLGRSGVYMFGFSPQEQTRRVVAYALKQGKSKIGALVPNSSLGETVLAAANDTLADSGAQLAASAHYASQGVGIDRAIGELAPTGAPPLDALLLPEGGASLGTILRALEQHGIKQPEVQLLGTGIWDDATLVRRASLDGAWLASSPPAGTAAFEKRFLDTYKYIPPRVVSLAYDAVSLAVTLATSDRGFTAASLTSSSGFSGPANGIFRLRANGQVERGLAVLQVEGAGFTLLDDAPTSFK